MLGTSPRLGIARIDQTNGRSKIKGAAGRTTFKQRGRWAGAFARFRWRSECLFCELARLALVGRLARARRATWVAWAHRSTWASAGMRYRFPRAAQASMDELSVARRRRLAPRF